ncbi:unnamed protein product [Lactuca saligna]|uniref:Uncharacterized protein n=1 Tax=Lactuca saligna TaxID=75948 RepID=A0AA36ELB4_LACSI|nr:unnamed protein product [Lactuca saligna]
MVNSLIRLRDLWYSLRSRNLGLVDSDCKTQIVFPVIPRPHRQIKRGKLPLHAFRSIPKISTGLCTSRANRLDMNFRRKYVSATPSGVLMLEGNDMVPFFNIGINTMVTFSHVGGNYAVIVTGQCGKRSEKREFWYGLPVVPISKDIQEGQS